MSKPRREVKEADIDPGLETMGDLARMTSLSARKPPPDELVQAVTKFFQAKSEKNEAIQDFQATLVLQTFRYLQVAPRPDESEPWIPIHVLKGALTTLEKLPKHLGEEHKILARAIFDEVESRQSSASSQELRISPSLVSLISVLSHAHAAEEARELLQKQLDDDTAAGFDINSIPEKDRRERGKRLSRAWSFVLAGFERQGNEAGVLGTVDLMKRYQIPFSNIHQRPIVSFFARRDDVQNTKSWYDHPLEAPWQGTVGLLGKSRLPDTYLAAIRLCIRKRDEEWGRKIVRDAMQNPDPEEMTWDAVFTWAAFMGKGVDEVDRMMTVMMERFPHRRPTSATINSLVEIAMERGDMYMAERFANLSERRQIPPDASTYILQMKYRLLSNDIDGARAAYQQLQTYSVEDNKDLTVVNQLIQAMCNSKQYDFESIIHIVEDVNLRRARFEPETVADLTLLHLARDELHDAIDLLQSHTFHYSIPQRAHIANALLQYCLAPTTSTTLAWDTYTILTQIFTETTRDDRTTIMTSFFTRRRPDMAVHVFNSMRASSRPELATTPETYIAALLGLARSATTISLSPGALSAIIRADAGLDPADDSIDIDGFGEGGALGESANELETLLGGVHAQLKLDPAAPSTALLTALMLAYTALGQPRRALEFWSQVAASREGPSWSSLHAALRACERAPFGDEEARRIWRRLRRMDVELGMEMWVKESGKEPGAFM